ncbi:hypothetical protein F0562_016089 [Nyssa sinensis]|uniref:Uncharacterized protein n=1 Tax=Nyssa sinensis TaxID=561372 RepID=A0A5J4ZJ13_9ASTE|nr:hypothetical protein F0562_016089 [Nyssa sinensis]
MTVVDGLVTEVLRCKLMASVILHDSGRSYGGGSVAENTSMGAGHVKFREQKNQRRKRWAAAQDQCFMGFGWRWYFMGVGGRQRCRRTSNSPNQISIYPVDSDYW